MSPVVKVLPFCAAIICDGANDRIEAKASVLIVVDNVILYILFFVSSNDSAAKLIKNPLKILRLYEKIGAPASKLYKSVKQKMEEQNND